MTGLFAARRFAALTLSIALATGPVAAVDKPAPATPPKPPSVTVVTAETREVVASTIVSGSLVAREEILVSPEIDGLAIVEILAEEGDRVIAGQVLARLSRVTLEVALNQNKAALARNEAMIAQSQAQIAEAEANALQAANALNRTKRLVTSGISSVEQFDQRQAGSSGAQARLASAKDALMVAQADKAASEAQRRDLEVKLGRTEITAPRGGLVSRRTAKLGAVAGMAGEPLFRLVAESAIELEADVPEADLARVKPGQDVQVTPAGYDKPIAGKVRLVSPEIDKTNRLGRIRVSLPEGSLKSIGGFARGSVEIGRRSGVTLPLSSITYARGGPIAQVVKDGKVESRPIALGLIGDGRAEILKGLAAGETVVARAGTFVRDGDLVTAVADAGEARP